MMPCTCNKIRLLMRATAICGALSCVVAAQAQGGQASSKKSSAPESSARIAASQAPGSSQAEARARVISGSGGNPRSGQLRLDNKALKGANGDCYSQRGGVDASGSENISLASMSDSHCTSKPVKDVPHD